MDKIIASFKRRGPVCAALLALVLDPSVAALFLNRGRLAVASLLTEIGLLLLPFGLASAGLMPFSPFVVAGVLIVVFKLVSIIAAFRIAARRDVQAPLRWYAKGAGLVLLAVIITAGPILLKNYGFAAYTVPSESMMPTLNPGDYVIADKTAKVPQRGDVIVFKTSKQPRVSFVKRVIGLPGDEVRMADGQVFINNVPVARQLLRSGLMEPTSPVATSLYGETLAGHGSYRVLGSSDGPLESVAAYKVPPGHYFVLGDYRDNSLDSRMPDFGDVQAGSIEGKMVVIAWHGGTRQFAWDRIN